VNEVDIFALSLVCAVEAPDQIQEASLLDAVWIGPEAKADLDWFRPKELPSVEVRIWLVRQIESEFQCPNHIGLAAVVGPNKNRQAGSEID